MSEHIEAMIAGAREIETDGHPAIRKGPPSNDPARDIARRFVDVYYPLTVDALEAAIRAYGDQRAAEEREACAKMADEQAAHATLYRIHGTVGATIGQRVSEAIAAAIRARTD